MILKKDNIVISCSKGKNTFHLIRILKKIKEFEIYGTDINNINSNNKKFFSNLGTQNKDYLSNLIENFKENNINKFIPLADEEVLHISKNIDIFKKNKIKVFCNKYKNILILNNKVNTLRFLEKNKIPIPKWKVFKNLIEYKKSLEFFFDKNLEIVIKPIISRGNRNINYFSKRNYIKIINNYLKFKKNFFINEKLYPKYYDIDLFSKKISIKNNIIIRQNLNPLNPTVYRGFKFISDKKIMSFCNIINNKLKNEFILDVDAMTDINNNVKVIEVNSRPSGAFIYSLIKNLQLKNEFIKYLKK